MYLKEQIEAPINNLVGIGKNLAEHILNTWNEQGV